MLLWSDLSLFIQAWGPTVQQINWFLYPNGWVHLNSVPLINLTGAVKASQLGLGPTTAKYHNWAPEQCP